MHAVDLRTTTGDWGEGKGKGVFCNCSPDSIQHSLVFWPTNLLKILTKLVISFIVAQLIKTVSALQCNGSISIIPLVPSVLKRFSHKQ